MGSCSHSTQQLSVPWPIESNRAAPRFKFTMSKQHQLVGFKLPSSSAVDWALLYAWCHHKAQSCSSPGWWKSERSSLHRSRCSTAAGQHKQRPGGHPESSSRWWSAEWGPGCTARSSPCPAPVSLEALRTALQCWIRETGNLERKWNSGTITRKPQSE